MVVVAALAGSSLGAQAQTVTVVEYYNKTIDAYFLTGRANEQTGLDGVADFQRTGMTFQAVAAATAPPALTQICRFYIGLTTPYVSSHFYGRRGVDCESLIAARPTGFVFEDYDFATQQPASGVCTTGTTAIYRSFRAASGGKTSNHRYSASLATYNAAILKGYVGEDVAFCATSATAATSAPPPTASGDCGAYFFPNKKLTLQATSSTLGVTSSATTSVRTYDSTPIIFRGRTVSQVIDTSPGSTSATMIEDGGSTYSEIGARGVSSSGTNETYYTPPIVYPKAIAIGQVINFTRAINNSPASPNGTGTQTGSITLASKESVTVPGGTFVACKFLTDQVTQYPSVGSNSRTLATSWIAIDVGVVRVDISDTTTVAGFNVTSTSQVLVTKVE